MPANNLECSLSRAAVEAAIPICCTPCCVVQNKTINLVRRSQQKQELLNLGYASTDDYSIAQKQLQDLTFCTESIIDVLDALVWTLDR